MTKSVDNTEENSSPKGNMYQTKASTNPHPKRFDNREESLILGSFIQWEDRDKANRKSYRKPPDRPPRKAPSQDVLKENGEKKSKINFIKRNKSDSSETRSPGVTPDRDRFNMFLEDVHLSRPATPQPVKPEDSGSPTDIDRYRIMYLLVRVEQQQEHLRHVLENMRRVAKPEMEIKNIVKVQGAIAKMYGYLIGVRDNDHVIMKQIGSRIDIEEFLGTIENTCSSVEEIPVPGSRDDKTSRLMEHRRNTRDKQEIKVPVKLRRRPNTPPTCIDVLKRLQNASPLATKTSKEMAVGSEMKTEDYMKKAANAPGESRHTSSKTPNHTRTKTGAVLPDIAAQMAEQSEMMSIMKEIDDLMDDTGLINGKHGNLLSYEAIMLGAGEKKLKDHVNRKLVGRQASQRCDVFIEELDRLLDECDS